MYVYIASILYFLWRTFRRLVGLFFCALRGLIRLPIVALRFVREVLMCMAVFAVILAVYFSVPPVKEHADHAMETTSNTMHRYTPSVITKGVKSVGVGLGILERPKNTLEKVLDHTKRIPYNLYCFFGGLTRLTFDKFLDAVLHPVVLLGGGLFLIVRYC